jgi:hypothetical protein
MRDYVEIEKVLLKKHEYCAAEAISEALLRTARFDESVHHLTGTLVRRLTSHVAAETLKKLSVRIPKTWWDAMKLRFLPKQMLKRYPVQMVEMKLEAKALYPHVSFPEEQHVIVMHKMERNYLYPECEK